MEKHTKTQWDVAACFRSEASALLTYLEMFNKSVEFNQQIIPYNIELIHIKNCDKRTQVFPFILKYR